MAVIEFTNQFIITFLFVFAIIFGVLQIANVLPKDKKWAVKKDENGCTLSVAHPGGGKVSIELTAAEVKQLINDLGQ